MNEDASEPDLDKPRFLLPDGCKDLNDVLKLQQQAKESGIPRHVSLKMPSTVQLPDPVTVRELASELRLRTFVLIGALIHLKVFASGDTKIEFATAAALCSHFGVVATRVT